MTNQDIMAHFQQHIAEHPHASYEEWIGALYPEKMHDSLLGDGIFGAIDSSFYEQDSEHRQLWNANLGGGVRFAAAAATSIGGGNDGSDSGSAGAIADFLSDGSEPGSPVVSPHPVAPVDPGQDLLSFD
jgi:hypothetical protein